MSVVAAWGPIEFTAAEMAIIFAYIGLIPPVVIAVAGFLVHTLVLTLRGRGAKLLPLFLRWWAFCTGGWIVGLIVASVVT